MSQPRRYPWKQVSAGHLPADEQNREDAQQHSGDKQMEKPTPKVTHLRGQIRAIGNSVLFQPHGITVTIVRVLAVRRRHDFEARECILACGSWQIGGGGT